MVGKTIYKAKTIEGKVKILAFKIVKETKNKYTLDKKYKSVNTCFKTDIGIILFLTKREALDYLIKELSHFVECGETYLASTKQLLEQAKVFPED